MNNQTSIIDQPLCRNTITSSNTELGNITEIIKFNDELSYYLDRYNYVKYYLKASNYHFFQRLLQRRYLDIVKKELPEYYFLKLIPNAR